MAARCWLVLAEPADAVGPWIRDGLDARGLTAELVTSGELFDSARWEHRVPAEGARATLEVTLADGRRLTDAGIAGVVNRLARVSATCLVRGEPEDRAFAEQEWAALLCSALHALVARGVPVIEPPGPYLPGGRWRSPAEWTVLASRAGFCVPPWRWCDLLPTRPDEELDHGLPRVLVVGPRPLLAPVEGEDGVAQAPPPGLAEACLRLAALAGQTVLAVVARQTPQGPVFLSSETQPDLRLWGEAALDALVAPLER